MPKPIISDVNQGIDHLRLLHILHLTGLSKEQEKVALEFGLQPDGATVTLEECSAQFLIFDSLLSESKDEESWSVEVLLCYEDGTWDTKVVKTSGETPITMVPDRIEYLIKELCRKEERKVVETKVLSTAEMIKQPSTKESVSILEEVHAAITAYRAWACRSLSGPIGDRWRKSEEPIQVIAGTKLHLGDNVYVITSQRR